MLFKVVNRRASSCSSCAYRTPSAFGFRQHVFFRRRLYFFHFGSSAAVPARKLRRRAAVTESGSGSRWWARSEAFWGTVSHPLAIHCCRDWELWEPLALPGVFGSSSLDTRRALCRFLAHNSRKCCCDKASRGTTGGKWFLKGRGKS